MSLTTLLLGRKLANREAEDRKLGSLEGVPAMGLDGLGSASYGPEAMLAVLAGAGSAGLAAVQPITWAILALLVMLVSSYWQTIAAYPSNGGSYVVARENLGPQAALLTAAALMLDYILNVAVGISAGIGALTSALPMLQPHTLALCLTVLAAIMLVNLRGTRESGRVLAVPTYLFIAGLLATLVVGCWAGGRGAAPPTAAHGGALPVWLVLRAFAAGCTAMTGVEAVSNGVGVFRDPAVRHARRTLVAISGTLGVLLLGIAWLARAHGILAMDQSRPGYQSVVSQLVASVWGRGPVYAVVMTSVFAVLTLSANTSFVGFPRLCRQVAADGYLPKAFAAPGRRLVYTAGLVLLAAAAGALLAAFGGITDRLIPLFAVGAFLSFTLGQAGMAVHWRRHGKGAADRARLLVNALGAVATGIALAIILAAKFTAGAWITLLVLPPTVLLLGAVHRYYQDMGRQVLVGRLGCVELADATRPSVLVPLEHWDMRGRRTMELATRISDHVRAVHLADLSGPDAEEQVARIRSDWKQFVVQPAAEAGLGRPELVIRRSPYRSLLGPLLREIAELQAAAPGRPVVVALNELVAGRWWETLLHTRRVHRLRTQLLKHGGPGISVLAVPWQLQPARTAAVLAEEEPSTMPRPVSSASK